MKKDVAFACERFQLSERRACKLPGMDRGSYRYEPKSDRNGPLQEALIALARQKPRYGHRRPHALLVRRDHPASVMALTGCIERKDGPCGALSESGCRVRPQ